MNGLLGNLFGMQEEDPLLAMLPPAQRAQLQSRVRSQGITNLGLALLQAGGPTTTPGGVGSRLGQAGMQAMQANQGLTDAELQRMTVARRMQMEQAQLERQQQQRAAMQQALGGGQVDVGALQQAAMLSDNPLTSLTETARAIPQLRRLGMMPGDAEANPFEMFMESPAESVRKAAQVYSQRFAQGMIEPEQADKFVSQLTSLEERAIGRQESLAARQEAQEANVALRRELAQQYAGQREQMLAMQREAQEDRRMTRELAQQDKQEAKAKRIEGGKTTANIVLGAVSEAKDLVGPGTAGFGGILANIPSTKARALRSRIDTITANLGFAELQKMREASPTGGALGQVALQELYALQRTVASLDQLQSPADLSAALNKIERHYNNWLGTLQQSGQQMPEQRNRRRYNPATGQVE